MVPTSLNPSLVGTLALPLNRDTGELLYMHMVF